MDFFGIFGAIGLFGVFGLVGIVGAIAAWLTAPQEYRDIKCRQGQLLAIFAGLSSLGLVTDLFGAYRNAVAPPAATQEQVTDIQEGLSDQDAELQRLRALLEQILANTAGDGPADPSAEQRRAEIVQEAFDRGDAEEIQALREIAEGDVAGGFDDIEAQAARIEAEGARLAARKWRDLGALSFSVDPGRSLTAYRNAARLEPTDFWTQHRLSFLELSVGGDLPAAQRAAAAALDLAEGDRERSSALDILGDAALQTGDLSAAQEAYGEALALARALLAANPTSAEARRDVFVSLWKTAEITDERADWIAVADHLEVMDRDGVLFPADLQFLDEARRRAGRD